MEELIQAVSERDYVKVQLLLGDGADVNAKDRRGWSPMLQAVRNDDLKMVQILHKYGARITGEEDPIWLAQNGTMIDILVRLGANPHFRCDEGRTLMHYADSVEVVETLMRYGVDVNVRDNSGHTPLWHVIANHGHPDRVACLLDYGAEIPYPRDRCGLLIEWLEGTDPRRDDLIRKVQMYIEG